MKKSFRKISCYALAAMMLFATACGEKSEKPEEPKTPEITTTDTEYDLVKDGKTDYAIVYDGDATSPIIDSAISELSLFFENATGITLPQFADDQITYSETAKYISLGETSLVEEAAVQCDKSELTPTGYTIQTVGQSVFLIGGGVYGTLNAVYGFLSEQFDYRCYAPDEIAIEKGVKNEKLIDFDLVDVPDITWRAAGTGEMFANTSYARRLRVNQQSDYIMYFGDAFCHNFFEVVDQKTREENPLWVSDHGMQLCLTRDRDGLVSFVVEKMKTTFLANPDSYAMSFTQEDDSGWCSCESCRACKAQYGTESAAYILFMNECARKLQVWQKEEGIDRELYIYMFAYQNTTDAPCTYNEKTGKWEPNAPELVLEPNLLVQYAPIYAAGYHSYDKEINKEFDDIMQKWAALTDKFLFWSYNYYYKGLNFHPYYDFSDLREMYKYMVKNDVVYLFEEDRVSGAKWTDWSRLKAFVRAELAWDTDADLNELYDSFFENYYKDAAGPMRKLFDSYSSYYTYIIKRDNIRGQGGVSEVEKESYWPKAMLDQWIGYIEEAYDTIEYLKEGNSAEYELLFDRICLDSITFRHLSETYYYSSVYVGNGNTLTQDKDRFGLNVIDT